MKALDLVFKTRSNVRVFEKGLDGSLWLDGFLVGVSNFKREGNQSHQMFLEVLDRRPVKERT